MTFACARAHYSRQTEKAYRYWIKAFILYHNKQHPSVLDAAHLEAFMNYLAADRRVVAATQSQALNAIAFLYKKVLAMECPWMESFTRAKQVERLPVVFSPAEVQRVIEAL